MIYNVHLCLEVVALYDYVQRRLKLTQYLLSFAISLTLALQSFMEMAKPWLC